MKSQISNLKFLLLPLCICISVVVLLPTAAAQTRPAPRVKTWLEGVEEEVGVIRSADGTHLFLLETRDGPVKVSPEDFAARVYEEQSHRDWWLLVLNISSPIGIAWVAIGLGGQLLFTGRMIVQLWASEKSKRSVVPIAFWWLSLIGATMLLAYFLWRKDIVGVLGQSIGWVIYLRNLYLIYITPRRGPRPASKPIDA